MINDNKYQSMNLRPHPPTTLIGKCMCRGGQKLRGKIIEGYATEVVILYRIMGASAAGKSLGEELFDEPLTATPVLRVVAKVASNEIQVSKEQLLAVVQQHEFTRRYYKLHPWIIDPTGKSAPPTKKGRKPGNDGVKKAAAKRNVTPPLNVESVVEPIEPKNFREEIESVSSHPIKGESVELPPDYKPDQFQPRPPKMKPITICGVEQQ